uniref:Uncharacterized protein n=1 Tax=Oryza rufipogon TaxID=4529 RepID=A0A1V1FJV3_ORYRU|nr:hypothetical protein [Oryza rufipogon]
MAKNPAPSRVHSPTLYFSARLRFACSPAPLRCRAGPPPPSPVVGVDLVFLDTVRPARRCHVSKTGQKYCRRTSGERFMRV